MGKKRSQNAHNELYLSQGENHGVIISYILPPTIDENRPTDLLKKQNDNDKDKGEKKERVKNAAKGGDREEDDEEEEEQEGEGDEEGDVDEESDDDGGRVADTNAVQSSRGPSWVDDLRNIMKVWEKQLGSIVSKFNQSELRIKDFFHYRSLQTQVLGGEKCFFIFFSLTPRLT